MNETVNITMETKLSKQEKTILKLIYRKILEHPLPSLYPIRIGKLSRTIAELFNKESNRIKKHKYDKLLTPSHRASFSRSLRRLEKRNLLIRSDHQGEITRITHRKTAGISLTKNGILLCKKLFKLNNQNRIEKKKKTTKRINNNEKRKEKTVIKDSYTILGISRNATENEIKIAYKKLAKKYHPDINKNLDANEKFIELNKAYTELTKQEPPSLKDLFTSILGGDFFGWTVNQDDFYDKKEIWENSSNIDEFFENLWNSEEYKLYTWASNKMNILRKLNFKVGMDLRSDHYSIKENPELKPFIVKGIRNVIRYFKRVLNNEVDIKEKIPKAVEKEKDGSQAVNFLNIYNNLFYNLKNQYHPKFINKFPEKYQLFIKKKMREMIQRLNDEINE